MAELRARGIAADTDYAGRSLKGQLTQAGRTGAPTVVIARERRGRRAPRRAPRSCWFGTTTSLATLTAS